LSARQSDEELRGLSLEDLRELANSKCADAQLLLTARAIQESQGPIRSLGKFPMVLVLAPFYLDGLNEQYVEKKRNTFRFVRPDGSGLMLDPVPA